MASWACHASSLRHSAFESERGVVQATGFLMDMNTLFQEFVTVALREALGVSERVFREKNIDTLDDGWQSEAQT